MENRPAAVRRQIANPAWSARLADKALGALIVLGLGTAALAGAVLHRTLNPPPPVIVASSGAGPLVPLRPLNEPLVDRTSLLLWARDCAVRAYDIDYVHYRQQQAEAQKCFLVDAWNGWAGSFRRSFDAIAEKNLVGRPVPLCPAELAAEGMLGDRYAWRVRLPLLALWENTQGKTEDRLLIEMTVTRTEDPAHPRGIAISQLVAKPWTRTAC